MPNSDQGTGSVAERNALKASTDPGTEPSTDLGTDPDASPDPNAVGPVSDPTADAQDTEDTEDTEDAEDEPGWFRRSPVRTAAIIIALFSLAVRVSVLKDAYFITDDFMLSSRAMENPLSLDYLARVHTGHFEPIGFGVMWLLAHLAPLNWTVAATAITIGQVLLLVMVWGLLKELFGVRWLILIPFALFCFTPLTMPAFTWLSAAIIWLPLMIAIAGMLRYHARYVRTGQTRAGVWAIAWFIVGLASFEKILVVLPYLVVFTLALLPDLRITVKNLVALVRRTWIVWAGYTVLTLGYLVIYLPGVRGAGNESPVTAPGATTLLDFGFLSIFRTLIPGIFGGPWDWQPSSYALAIVDSPRAFDWLMWTVAFAVVVTSLVVRRRIGRQWVALAVYLLGSMATIAVGRVAYTGAILALEARYLADATIPVIVCLGACLMPLVGERRPWTASAERVNTAVGRRGWVIAGATAGAVVLALSLNAIGRYAQFSSANPYESFVDNSRTAMASLPADAQVYDTPLPNDLIGPIFKEYNLVSRYLAPFATPEQREQMYTLKQFSNPYMLTKEGKLMPFRVDGSTSPPPLAGMCGWQPENGRIVVPLQSAAFEWTWAVRIGYLTGSETSVTVKLGKGSQRVDLGKGLGSVTIPLTGGGSEVIFDDVEPGAQICIGDVAVGNPVPVAAP